MPAERTTMHHVREVLRLTTAGVGLNEIARRVGIAPSTVRLTFLLRLRPEIRCGLSRQKQDAERVSGRSRSSHRSGIWRWPPQRGNPDKADDGERCIILRAERSAAITASAPPDRTPPRRRSGRSLACNRD